MMVEEQLKEAAREPKQVTTDDKFACSPPICLMAVLPAKAYHRFVSPCLVHLKFSIYSVV